MAIPHAVKDPARAARRRAARARARGEAPPPEAPKAKAPKGVMLLPLFVELLPPDRAAFDEARRLLAKAARRVNVAPGEALAIMARVVIDALKGDR